MEQFFLIISAITIIAALIKLVRKDAWWIRFFDFPQWQVVVIGYAALAGLLLTWRYTTWHIVFLVILAAILVYETLTVYPYTWFGRHESPRAKGHTRNDQVSLMICNIYMYNTCYSKCLDLIREKDPDVIVLVETDMKWMKKLRVLDDDYPFQVKYPLDNTYGMMVLSRLELINPEVKFLVESDVPSIHVHFRMRNGHMAKLYAVHPKPPSPTQNDRSTERDAELYLIAREVEQVEGPVIVAGDLNDVAWSRSTRIFQRISLLLDPRKGRGFYNTFHAKYPVFRWPLDHLFHSGEFGLVRMERLPGIGSDHFPMFVHLAWIGERHEGDPHVEYADEEDIEEVSEKIRAAM